MNVLITGAKGFVGNNLAEALKNIRDGKDRTRPDLKIEGIYLYDIDSSEEELETACEKADFVFNLAGVNRPKDSSEFIKGNFGFAEELLDLFQKIGILTYAKVVSKISAMYFHINCPKWAEDADEELCHDVMNDVLTGGNFGRKDRIRSKSGVMIIERSRNGKKHSKLVNLFLIIHQGIPEHYPIVKKIPILYPIFDCYRILLYLIRTLKGERTSVIKLLPEANKRKSVYDRLHLFETANNEESD